jgi:hypothetical protein
MSNLFSKEEIVIFENETTGFEDALVMSRLVAQFNTSGTQMARSNNTVWRPQPYIAITFDGLDQTPNFGGRAQLSVPATITHRRSAPFSLDAEERRDALQSKRLAQSAGQQLASDVNDAVNQVAMFQGTLVVAQPDKATGFRDLALCEGVMNNQGVPSSNRYSAINTDDYNDMSANLAERQTLTQMTEDAYKNSYIDRISTFQTYKLDYGDAIEAAQASSVVIDGAGQSYTPESTIPNLQGNGVNNKDNRYQEINVTVGSGLIAPGDSFTIAGVFAVHNIRKGSTGKLKTFRVIAVPGGGGTGVITISPPIISGSGGSIAAVQYQNVTPSGSPADGAALTFLNTTTAKVNPFWQKDAIEILPASYSVPTDAGAAVMRLTTETGLELLFVKQFDINTLTTKYRIDCYFGVVNKSPEMSGIMMFGQS